MKRIKNNRYVAGFLSLIVLFSIFVPQFPVFAAESKTYDFGLFQINVTLNQSSFSVGANDVEFQVSSTMNVDNTIVFESIGKSTTVNNLSNVPMNLIINDVDFTSDLTTLPLNITVDDGMGGQITLNDAFQIEVNTNNLNFQILSTNNNAGEYSTYELSFIVTNEIRTKLEAYAGGTDQPRVLVEFLKNVKNSDEEFIGGGIPFYDGMQFAGIVPAKNPADNRFLRPTTISDASYATIVQRDFDKSVFPNVGDKITITIKDIINPIHSGNYKIRMSLNNTTSNNTNLIFLEGTQSIVGTSEKVQSVTITPSNVVANSTSDYELDITFLRDSQAPNVTGYKPYLQVYFTSNVVGSMFDFENVVIEMQGFSGSIKPNYDLKTVDTMDDISMRNRLLWIDLDRQFYKGDKIKLLLKNVKNPPIPSYKYRISTYVSYDGTEFSTDGMDTIKTSIDSFLVTQPITLTSIDVTPAIATINKDDTQQYTAIATYSDNSTVDVTNAATWSIDDTTKATINAAGLATGTNAGDVIVTATYQGMSDTANLKVIAPTVTDLFVLPENATIKEGETQQYRAIAKYSDNSTVDVTNTSTWNTADTTISTVNATGLASGIKAGKTKVSASFSGLTDDGDLTVLAVLQSLTVSPKSATIEKGDAQQYIATAHYSDNSNVIVTNSSTWTVDDNSKATINNNGLATGTDEGNVVVTVTYQGMSDTATLKITVTPPPPPPVKTLTSLDVTPKTATINKGDTQQYTAIATYSDNSTSDVTNASTWSINDTTKATINAAGLAIGTNAGDVVVTATYQGMSDTASLTIQDKEKDPVIPIPKMMTGLSVTPKSAEIKVGEFQLYQAIATYSDLSTKDITNEAVWNSSDTSISTVEKGKANGLKKGKVDITATYNGLSDQAILSVTENEKLTGGGEDPKPKLISLVMKPKKAVIEVGQTQEYQAIATWDNGISKDVTLESTWKGANKEIAILEGHKALGIKKGQTTITVSYGNLTDNGILKVIDNTIPTDNPKEIPEPPASPDTPNSPKIEVDVTPRIKVKKEVGIGEKVQATIDIRNIGKDDVIDSFNNRLYAKKKESLLASLEPLSLAKAEEWVLITRFTVEGGLTAGESKVVTVPLTFNEHGEYLLKIVSDEEMIVVNDINRDNNKDETVTVTVGDPIGTPKEESPIPRITPKVPKTGDGSINKNYDSELLVGLLLFSLFTSFIAHRRLVSK